MSKIDINNKGFHSSLDGNPPCPGQNLEGKNWDDEHWEMIQKYYDDNLKKEYPYHLEFLTIAELREFHYLDHYLSQKRNQAYSLEKFKNQTRHMELVDKLDYNYLFEMEERDYQKRRHEQILQKKLINKSNNRYELGAREFTFTYSPKWFDDSEARLQMSSAIQKLCKYYKDEIIQLRAVGETGTNGLSHIHCFYKLKDGKKITDKNFKRAYSQWDTKVKQGPTGHKGGHHATVKSESDFQGYIEKDIETSWFEVNIDNSADPTN